jgi:hypothetical protein
MMPLLLRHSRSYAPLGILHDRIADKPEMYGVIQQRLDAFAARAAIAATAAGVARSPSRRSGTGSSSELWLDTPIVASPSQLGWVIYVFLAVSGAFLSLRFARIGEIHRSGLCLGVALGTISLLRSASGPSSPSVSVAVLFALGIIYSVALAD